MTSHGTLLLLIQFLSGWVEQIERESQFCHFAIFTEPCPIAQPMMSFNDFAWATAIAALFSGIPSTVWSFFTTGDVMEATRAAGSMLIDEKSDETSLLLAAIVAHFSISTF